MKFIYRWLTGGCVLLSVLAAIPGFSAQDDVRITEFMASNTRTLTDENGFFEDWIEIFNAGDNTVNLLNWSLRDSGDTWLFPSTNIAPGHFMVIFASGNDRRIPGARLHTNFRLDAGGDLLALVKPDGTTIATIFPVTYPNPAEYQTQVPDVSYGFGVLTTNQTLISTSSLVRVRVPLDNSDGTNWTLVSFNDSGWTLGTNGVGFGRTNAAGSDYGANVLPTAPVGYWRFSETNDFTATNSGSGVGLDAAYISTAPGTAGPRPAQFSGFELDNYAPTFDGSNSYVTVNNSLLSGRGAFTIGGWIKPAATPAARSGLFGQNDCVEFGFINGTQLQCLTPGGGSVTANYGQAAGTWHHVAAVGNGSTIRIFVDGNLAASGGTATANYGASGFNFNIGGNGIFDASTNFFNGQIDEVVVYHRALSTNEIRALYQAGAGLSVAPFVKTDLASAMSNINASAYLRFAFNMPDFSDVAALTLRVRYDDGLAAYLNGSEITRFNAPLLLDNTSAATSPHLASFVEEYRFDPTALQTGTNILAIHGLNLAAGDPDFLIVAELIATRTAESSTPIYFTTATPGTNNSGGVLVPGPAILDAEHAPNVPLDSQDVLVTAQVLPTFAAVSSVVLRYRVMFASEIELAMFDDGAHGDGAAGDRVYGATIPASASTNGQMIRWYFRATDILNRSSRWPLFTNPTNTAEYLGTIVDPTNVTSKLPIVHIFAPAAILSPGPTTTQTGADSQAGAQASLFHDGEFYDNIRMELRGNSTANYNKKSHRLNFNREHTFRQQGMDFRIRHTSFVADYPDPAYMRQGLTYFLGELMGIPSPFYNPVRLQLNGQFYQLANHNDVPEAEHLERLGYDGNGALYNAAGRVTLPVQSTGGFEKKTRKWDNNNDYNLLATSIAETNSLALRRTNMFEFFDIPNAINYLVLGRWVHENDDVWANMSLYHDNDGDNLWRLVPFDMNLSWGAIFAEGDMANWNGVQATNDNHKAHPLYGSVVTPALSGPTTPDSPRAWNRVYDTFFQIPQTREMFLRRMRTLMDTYIKPPGTPASELPVEKHVLEVRDLIAEEALRDRAWWGWPAAGGQGNFQPGIDITNGVAGIINEFIGRRRLHFYGKHSITNTALPTGITKTDKAGIPLSQPTNAIVQIASLEYNPPSANQGQEYLCITNPNAYAVDISGWKISNAIEFTFKGGTVIPSNYVLYVTPDIVSFRTRSTSPRGREALFVVGNYSGNLSARGEMLDIYDDRGRLVHTNGFVGNPSLVQQFLRVTEIMYHPALPPVGSPYDRELFEYIELKNIGPLTLNLTGVYFTNGISFSFTGSMVTSLMPGETVLVVRHQAAFISRYGTGFNIAGQYSGALDNGGERLRLNDSVNEEIQDFEYNNSWYPVTDGHGFSLVIVNENAPFNTWDEKESWRPSGVVGGSPDDPDPAPPMLAPILVNEVLSHTDEPGTRDAIELYNPTASEVDIGGWFITDDFTTARKYRIPDGTTIAAGGYRIFDETHFNPNPGVPPSFSFSALGDEAFVFSGNASSNLTGYLHGFDYGAAENAISFGRYVNSETNVHFVAQSMNTFGAANAPPKVGPIVIGQIMYHPPDNGTNDNSADEYIRLDNFSTNAMPLYDPIHPTNTWRLRDAADFDFPTNVVLPPGGSLVVAGFDPGNPIKLAAFRNTFGISNEVQVFGPLDGQLDNSGENVELYKPDTPDTNGVPYVLVEQIQYRDRPPWPPQADGQGRTLQRIHASAYGNDPTNWTALRVVRAKILAQPQGLNVRPGSNITFSVVATSLTSVVRYQWQINGANIFGATNSSYNIPNVQTNHEGFYTVIVADDVGSVLSDAARLIVLINPSIVKQPQVFQTVLVGDTVSFTVVAAGTQPFGYRWRKEGLPFIPPPSSATITLSNVPLSYHSNRFSAVITNLANPNPGIICSNAYLFVLVDTDGDRMPDIWEEAYGLNATNAVDGTSDLDGDTMINKDEWLAGTDPQDPQSYLKLDAERGTGNAELSFVAVSNKTYTVQYKNTLEELLWLPLANVDAHLTNRIETIVDAYPAGARYYRLVTPQQE